MTDAEKGMMIYEAHLKMMSERASGGDVPGIELLKLFNDELVKSGCVKAIDDDGYSVIVSRDGSIKYPWRDDIYLDMAYMIDEVTAAGLLRDTAKQVGINLI